MTETTDTQGASAAEQHAGRSLAGKVALVTGGGRGIGSAICAQLAGQGALVAVAYRADRAAADATIAHIEASGGHAFALRAEMGSVASIAVMLEQLDRELVARTGQDKFDILVNNAGVAPPGTIEQTTEEMFDEVIAVNLKGPFFLTQGALRRLRDGGRIINISSTASFRGRPSLAVYGPSKAALNQFNLTMAHHLGPRGITVNAIAPGVVDTDINAGYVAENPDLYAEVGKRLALGRVGKPRDLSSIVGFIASDEASWITGQVIYVDGGSLFQ